jgi:hypothetical protein
MSKNRGMNKDQAAAFERYCQIQARDALIFEGARRFGYITKTIEERDGQGWHRLRDTSDHVFGQCRIDDDGKPEYNLAPDAWLPQ